MKIALKYWVCVAISFIAIPNFAQSTDSLSSVKDTISITANNKQLSEKEPHTSTSKGLKLNEEAIKLIQFDFAPTNQSTDPKTASMDKPWMDFQVDLAVPKNMIDSEKVRKPENPRLLPYTIWTGFGEDPVYDVLVFGNKKEELSIHWTLDLDFEDNYGLSIVPMPKSMIPSGPANSSVVIGDLDFMKFIYDNFTKQGRIRKHNQKYANAWKTYRDAGPVFNQLASLPDSSKRVTDEVPSVYKRYASISLLDEKDPLYVEKPNHELLQTSEQRSRFGTFNDPELYALPGMNVEKSDEEKKEDSFRASKKKKRRKVKSARNEDKEKENEFDELPNTMEEVYQYIRMKKEQEALKRAELSRKDKVTNNAYDLEKQQRKLKEEMN